MNAIEKYKEAIAIAILAVAALTALMAGLDRPLWFDEAVSLMNFATLPYSEIYTNYTIPNNHILFNMLLKSWLDNVAPSLSVGDVQFRIPAVIIALTTICAIFANCRKQARQKVPSMRRVACWNSGLIRKVNITAMSLHRKTRPIFSIVRQPGVRRWPPRRCRIWG